MQWDASAKRMGGFLLCPIFSVHFVHLRVDFLCHNPVTLAVLCEFDILIYSLPGFYGAQSLSVQPATKKKIPSHELRGGDNGEGLDACAENAQIKRMV